MCHPYFHAVHMISRASVNMWIESKAASLKARAPFTPFFPYHTEYNVKANIFIFALLLNIFSFVLSSVKQRTSNTSALVTALSHR
jgi:hypothetical protein